MDIAAEHRLSGRPLRWVLLVVLSDNGSPMTVAELASAVERMGFAVSGRASKTVSDALRWEVRRGRVVRVARSTYRLGYLAASTAWWVRQRVRALPASIHPTS
jgi:hypothetical protein